MVTDFIKVYQNHLLDISEARVLNAFWELADTEKDDVIAYIVSTYGFSSAFEFLLVISKYWLSFDSCNWLRIVKLYDSHRAKSTLLDFFLLYTSTRDRTFFLQIGIAETEFESVSKSSAFLNKPDVSLASRFDKSLYKKLGLPVDLVFEINSYEVFRCDRHDPL